VYTSHPLLSAAYAHPHVFVLLPAFEMGPTGKIDRRSLPSLSSVTNLPLLGSAAAAPARSYGIRSNAKFLLLYSSTQLQVEKNC
jgi:hypothetical protein